MLSAGPRLDDALRLWQRPIMFPDSFQTARLLLRPLQRGDAPAIFDAYAQDPDVTRYLSWRPHDSVEQTERYVDARVGSAASTTYAMLTDDALVGAFDLRRATSARLDVGYVLARAQWGRGLVTEALCEVVGWALRQPSIWRISALADVDNVASARVMEKAGLTREGLLRRYSIHPNIGEEPRDCISYAAAR